MKSAKQASGGAEGSPSADLHNFEFTWDGPRLTEIAERGTGSYRRTMTYGGGRLLSESIASGAGHARIEYKYNGDRLVAAECSEDASLGGRSRRVAFQ